MEPINPINNIKKPLMATSHMCTNHVIGTVEEKCCMLDT
jgi:hypothetical protein